MRTCIIIDAYSTGSQYAEVLNQLDYRCLHIQSSEILPDFITSELKAADFFAAKTHLNIDDTLSWINTFAKPEFILPGSDSGVMLADQLSDLLQLPMRNNIALSLARRDKYAMGEAIRAQGIRAIKQLKTNSVENIKKWMSEYEVSWPIILKPLRSGSAEGFKLCQNITEVTEHLKELLDARDLFNQINDEVLVQEYIAGTEYVVNTISCNSQHVVSEYCIYNKFINDAGCSIYRSTRYLPRDFKQAQCLKDYAFSVLNALKINFGPAHAEIMVDDKGPVLVEIGARPAGANMDRELLYQAYHHTQLDLSVLAYIAPDKFLAKMHMLDTKLHQELSQVYLLSNKNGVIQQVNINKIEKLKSFKKIEMFLKVGNKVRVAQNLEDLIGIVYLQHSDKEIFDNDLKYLEMLDVTEYLTLQP